MKQNVGDYIIENLNMLATLYFDKDISNEIKAQVFLSILAYAKEYDLEVYKIEGKNIVIQPKGAK